MVTAFAMLWKSSPVWDDLVPHRTIRSQARLVARRLIRVMAGLVTSFPERQTPHRSGNASGWPLGACRIDGAARVAGPAMGGTFQELTVPRCHVSYSLVWVLG